MIDAEPVEPGLTPGEYRIRAAFYRHMARSAPEEDVREGLMSLAAKYERMAAEDYPVDS
jgi:hypothetical protein